MRHLIFVSMDIVKRDVYPVFGLVLRIFYSVFILKNITRCKINTMDKDVEARYIWYR